MESHQQLEFKESDEFIGREPSWIVKSGITLIGTTLTVLIFISWLIKYPNTLTAEVVITSPIPPVDVISRINGKVSELYVDNNEIVSKNQILAILESNASYESILRLDKFALQVKEYFKSSQKSELEIKNFNIEELGELRIFFDKLANSLTELQLAQDSKSIENYTERTNHLKELNRELLLKLEQKYKTWIDKRDLEKSKLNKKLELLERGIITETELQPFQNSFFNSQLIANNIDTEIKINELKIVELDQKLLEFRTRHVEEIELKLAKANLTLNALLDKVDIWKRKYLIRAPIDGTVSFNGIWSQGQDLKIGDNILTIVKENQYPIGKIRLNVAGAAKIKVNQMVNIELFDYPKTEFGLIKAKVKAKSSVPKKSGYLVDIELPLSLETTHKRFIPISPELRGKASIILDEKRLLERYLEKLLVLFKN
jgi:HlyD family secretion protein